MILFPFVKRINFVYKASMMNNSHFKISIINQVNLIDKTRTRKLKIFGELSSYFLWTNAANIVNDESSDINFTGKSTFLGKH